MENVSYKITGLVNVCVDDYKQGELDHVNNWDYTIERT